MKAKTLTLISKALSVVFVITAFIFCAVMSKEPPTTDAAVAIITVGAFVGGIFAPVDLSILVKNLKGNKDESTTK